MGPSCSQPCERCVLKKGTNKPLVSGHLTCLVQNPPCLAQEGQATVGSDSKVMEVGTERELGQRLYQGVSTCRLFR